MIEQAYREQKEKLGVVISELYKGGVLELRLKNKKEITVYGCETCKNDYGTKFCGDCGRETRKYVKETKVEVDTYKIRYLNNKELVMSIKEFGCDTYSREQKCTLSSHFIGEHLNDIIVIKKGERDLTNSDKEHLDTLDNILNGNSIKGIYKYTKTLEENDYSYKKVCTRCNEIKDGNYCNHCGKKLTERKEYNGVKKEVKKYEREVKITLLDVVLGYDKKLQVYMYVRDYELTTGGNRKKGYKELGTFKCKIDFGELLNLNLKYASAKEKRNKKYTFWV